MRLIDADALIDALGISDEDFVFKEILEDEPTIDAVPVVRCKDCKHFKSETENTGVCDGGFCHAPVHVAVIDFCPYGERKDHE